MILTGVKGKGWQLLGKQNPVMRGLAEASAEVLPADILIVRTAPQLLHALQNGHQDVEIREHMDVSDVTLSRLLAHVFSTTRSIRVC
jgi:hypothetical protein